MFRSLRTATRRRAVLLASGTAVVLAVGGGATAAFATGVDSTPTPSTTTATCQVHLRAIIRGEMPAELKADLKTLRAEPKGAKRVAERKIIRQKALDGTYGDRIEKVAHIAAGKAAAGTRVALPAALKADLKTLRATAPKSDARKAEAAKIAQQAIAGDYGTTIEKRAQAVQKRVQERCAAK